MLTISAVKIEGFRGLPRTATLAFDCPVTLLLAENHQGKSSVLNAIEWCLFGDECVGAATGLRERIGWEIVNRESHAARVEVRLTDGCENWVVQRSQGRIGKRTQSVTLVRPDGTKIESSAAKRQLASVINLNFRDFFCTAYQHQESVRGVLIQEPRERNDAIDRLLGLSDFRNMVEALRQAKVPEFQKGILERLEVFQAKVREAFNQRSKYLQEKKNEGASTGLCDADFEEGPAIGRAMALAKAVEEIALEMTLSAGVLPDIKKWPDVKPFCSAVETALNELLRQTPEVKAQENLLAERSLVVKARVGCETADQTLKEINGKLESLMGTVGTRDSLETRVDAAKRQLAELEAQIRATAPKASLVEEGITLLETSGLGVGKELCPLCGHEVEDLLAHLKAEWEQQLKRQIEKLLLSRKQFQDQLHGWAENIDQLDKLERERAGAIDGLGKASAAAAQTLSRLPSTGDDFIALCNQKIKEIDAALEKVSVALKLRQDRFDQVRSRIAALRVIFEVLALQARIDVLDKIWDCKEAKELDRLRDEMAVLADDVDAIQTAVRNASTEAASSKITAAQAAVQKYFVAMAANPALQQVELKVEQKANGNDYHVLDRSGEELTPILSQGDLNCLALAMFFGLAEARDETQGLSLMMLDDPSQSLGEGHLHRLVEVLNQITQTRPTILATMDTAFGQMLRQDLLKAKAIYEFQNWTPEQGPKITRGGALAGLAA